MHATLRLACFLLLLASGGAALAGDLQLGPPLPRFDLVKEGTHRYLRFMKAGEASTPADIWTRDVKFGEADIEFLQALPLASSGVNGCTRMDAWASMPSTRPAAPTAMNAGRSPS